MYTLPNMTGRTVVLTGATSGIGRQAALCFSAAGARLIAVARDPAKAQSLIEACAQQAGATIPLMVMGDLMEQKGVHAIADEIEDSSHRLIVEQCRRTFYRSRPPQWL